MLGCQDAERNWILTLVMMDGDSFWEEVMIEAQRDHLSKTQGETFFCMAAILGERRVGGASLAFFLFRAAILFDRLNFTLFGLAGGSSLMFAFGGVC